MRKTALRMLNKTYASTVTEKGGPPSRLSKGKIKQTNTPPEGMISAILDPHCARRVGGSAQKKLQAWLMIRRSHMSIYIYVINHLRIIKYEAKLSIWHVKSKEIITLKSHLRIWHIFFLLHLP